MSCMLNTVGSKTIQKHEFCIWKHFEWSDDSREGNTVLSCEEAQDSVGVHMMTHGKVSVSSYAQF